MVCGTATYKMNVPGKIPVIIDILANVLLSVKWAGGFTWIVNKS